MKNKLYYLIAAVYLIVLLFTLQREISLQHEWLLIMEESSFQKGLWMLGKPTAYMPPLYAYYLLLCRSVFGFTDWIKVSVIIQAAIYFYALRFLFLEFITNALTKSRNIVLFASLLFFPPILLGNMGISSFSLSVSFYCVISALLHRIYHSERPTGQNVFCLLLLGIAGLYLRYEFIYILILWAVIYLILRKIQIRSFVALCLLIFISYLPWMTRNYIAIGKFTYSTSLSYNFAKGYNEKYNIFSAYNFPYSPETDEILKGKVLYSKFRSEKDMDTYLSQLNKSFVSEHPAMFIKLTLQKMAINALQYFPDYNGISGNHLYIYYSAFFVVFQIILLLALKKMYERSRKYLFAFTLSLYLFFLIFYSIAPLPRYMLFIFPIFIAIIIKTFEEEGWGKSIKHQNDF